MMKFDFKFRNPVWVGPDMVDCEIEFRGQWMPFTSSPNDTEEYGRELFALLSAELGPCAATEIKTTSEGPE